jgi:transmembrane sensor
MTRSETAREIDDVAAQWAARIDRAPLSPEEERALQAWLDADPRHFGAFARVRAIALHTERARALGPRFDPAQFGRTSPRPSRNGLTYGAIAAAFIALFAAGTFLSQSQAQIYTTRVGQVQVAPLADGSVVTLNTASEVAVTYSESQRTLDLVSGEATFDVAKNPQRPFVVTAGDVEVRAVGTSFTVRHLPNAPVEVLVSEGVVDVVRDGQIKRIGANLKAVAAKAVTVTSVAPEKVVRQLAWRDGRLAFEGDTLRQAAAEFARYSDTRIVIDDPALASRTITGLYVPTDPVGFARAVGRAMNLEVAVSQGEVRLSQR